MPRNAGISKGAATYWYSMTREQRSAEMKRRQMIARKKREAKMKGYLGATTESPFPKETTIKARLEKLETELAALKQELGL